MGWNHRILAHEDGELMYFQIHEVYYNEYGTPNGYSTNAVSVGGDTIKSITWTLNKMKETKKYLEKIKEHQMQTVQLAISTEVYKLADNALKAFDVIHCCKTYQVDFGNNLRAITKITDNKIEIEKATDGWGDPIMLSHIEITEIK